MPLRTGLVSLNFWRKLLEEANDDQVRQLVVHARRNHTLEPRWKDHVIVAESIAMERGIEI